MTTALMLHRADGTPLSTAFRQAALSPDDPFAQEREIAWEGPNAMSAGRVSFVGERDVAHFPHTETLAVVEGELTLTAPGAAPQVIGVGAGAVIASGTAVRIEAAAGARFVFCAAAGHAPTTPGQPGFIPLRADADFKPSGGPAAEVLIGPAPQCRSDNVFTDEPTQYRAGTWDSTPYHRIVRPHPVNEFMVVLDGGVRFASPNDLDGSALSVSTGDAIFVPQGAAIGWESTARVAKFYVVQNALA